MDEIEKDEMKIWENLKKNIEFFLLIARGMKCCKIKSLLGVRRRFQLPYCITIFWEQTSSDQTTLSPSCCEILRNAGAAAEGSAAAGSGVVGVAVPVPGQHTPIEHGWTRPNDLRFLASPKCRNSI